jgi:hypothetical protein
MQFSRHVIDLERHLFSLRNVLRLNLLEQGVYRMGHFFRCEERLSPIFCSSILVSELP